MIWVALIANGIIFSIACFYLAKEKGKDSTTWAFIGFFLGIIGLLMIGFSEKNEAEMNEHSEEFIEIGSYEYDEALINRAIDLKNACSMWTTSQITKELIKEGYEIISEDQIENLFENIRDKSSIDYKLNKKIKEKSIRKDKPKDLKEDVFTNIEKLGDLFEKGYISQEEFDEKKKRFLDQL